MISSTSLVWRRAAVFWGPCRALVPDGSDPSREMEIDANSAWWNLELHETNTSLERGTRAVTSTNASLQTRL